MREKKTFRRPNVFSDQDNLVLEEMRVKNLCKGFSSGSSAAEMLCLHTFVGQRGVLTYPLVEHTLPPTSSYSQKKDLDHKDLEQGA